MKRPRDAAPRRGLNREQAADYVGVSPGAFDELVAAGTMPAPLDYGIRRNVWDKATIDASLDSKSQIGASSRHADDPMVALDAYERALRRA